MMIPRAILKIWAPEDCDKTLTKINNEPDENREYGHYAFKSHDGTPNAGPHNTVFQHVNESKHRISPTTYGNLEKRNTPKLRKKKDKTHETRTLVESNILTNGYCTSSSRWTKT